MSGTGGWQTQVAVQPAAFIPGSRTSMNPLFSFDAGPGGLVSGSSLFVGRFAWVTAPLDPNGGPMLANSFGNGPPNGYLMSTQQALNTTFLSNAGMQVQPGAQTALMIGGDFAIQNDGTTEAEYGQVAYAFVATGKATFAPSGTVFGGASGSASSIAAATFSVTGSISGNTMTVTAVGSGTVVAGASVSGTAIPTAPAPQVVSQTSGTPGGVGIYQLNTGEITTVSETISGTYGILTIGGTVVGTFAVGDVLTGGSGPAITVPTTITQNLTGSGGSGGTMAVNVNTVIGSGAIVASLAVATKFIARSTGLPGEAVKISSYVDAGGN